MRQHATLWGATPDTASTMSKAYGPRFSFLAVVVIDRDENITLHWKAATVWRHTVVLLIAAKVAG